MMKIKNSSIIYGAIAVSLAAMLWGVDGVLLTPRLHNLDTGFVVFVIHLIPFLLMNFFLWRSYKSAKTFNKKELIALFLVALFGGVIGTMAIVKALFLVNFEQITVVVLLQKIRPIFAIILARFLLKERINSGFALWATIAIVAGYFLTFGSNIPDFYTGNAAFTAALLSLLAAFSFASSTVFSKMALKNVPFQTATFFRYGFTTVLMLLYVTIFGGWDQLAFVTTENWIILSIIVLTTGSGAIFLYYYGLKKVKAIVATVCELLFPLTAVLLDFFVNDLVLEPIQWISAVVMVGSIVMLNVRKKKSK